MAGSTITSLHKNLVSFTNTGCKFAFPDYSVQQLILKSPSSALAGCSHNFLLQGFGIIRVSSKHWNELGLLPSAERSGINFAWRLHKLLEAEFMSLATSSYIRSSISHHLPLCPTPPLHMEYFSRARPGHNKSVRQLEVKNSSLTTLHSTFKELKLTNKCRSCQVGCYTLSMGN